MKVMFLDLYYQRRLSILIYLLIGSAVLFFAARHTQEAVMIAYLFLVIYWNGIFKSIGAPPSWKLLWSLPLPQPVIAGGLILRYLLMGWGMNLFLFLFVRFRSDLPAAILLLACSVSLLIDLFVLVIQLIPNAKVRGAAAMIGFLALLLFPYLLSRQQVRAALEAYLTLPGAMRLLPPAALCLAGFGSVFLLYRRFRRRWEM